MLCNDYVARKKIPLGRRYSQDTLDLELSEKAQSVLSDTDCIEIYEKKDVSETEDDDVYPHSYTYTYHVAVDNWIDTDKTYTAEQVNRFLEDWYDEREQMDEEGEED